jgi:hypothetical protein
MFVRRLLHRTWYEKSKWDLFGVSTGGSSRRVYLLGNVPGVSHQGFCLQGLTRGHVKTFCLGALLREVTGEVVWTFNFNNCQENKRGISAWKL